MPTDPRKLVKAMFKAEGDLPEGVLCCAALREKYEKQKHLVFDVDLSSQYDGPSGCHHCGQDFGMVRFVNILNRPEYQRNVWIKTLDLDEGAYAD
jgi:hypothetical protein